MPQSLGHEVAEFSIAIAGLATTAGVVADFEALAISYVFVLAIVGPVLVRFADTIGESLVRRAEAQETSSV